ncbi:hypothetical protein [Microbaculum marinum]|uniref:Bacteriophage-related protein n=1 Tax=Microbaculum marinum TaxID=1764581 RepID=A0AAW9RET4_9HYPH
MNRGTRIPETITLHVPFRIVKRGGRKQVILPGGACRDEPRRLVDNTIIKAIARAHRWQRLLERGCYASVTELADGQKINSSYLSRILRLTLLAPDIVEAILDGRHPVGLHVDALAKPLPLDWAAQRVALGL